MFNEGRNGMWNGNQTGSRSGAQLIPVRAVAILHDAGDIVVDDVALVRNHARTSMPCAVELDSGAGRLYQRKNEAAPNAGNPRKSIFCCRATGAI
jgi:hypothetical protein